MGTMVKPLTWDGMPSAKLRVMFKILRAPFVGWLMVSVANMFVNKMIPDMIVRNLSKEEHDHYREPYPHYRK